MRAVKRAAGSLSRCANVESKSGRAGCCVCFSRGVREGADQPGWAVRWFRRRSGQGRQDARYLAAQARVFLAEAAESGQQSPEWGGETSRRGEAIAVAFAAGAASCCCYCCYCCCLLQGLHGARIGPRWGPRSAGRSGRGLGDVQREHLVLA